MSQPTPSEHHAAFPERLGIVGSGTIACGVAACVADAGGRVTLWARSAESAERARGRMDGLDAAAEVVTDLEALAEATLVVEAVAERPHAKHGVYRALRDVRAQGALLATTTSSLSVSALALESGDPSRFFGLHVFNPVTRMGLVELCFPDAATQQLRARAAAFCEAIGKTGVEVPDEPGFVVNRLLFPYLFDAVRLLERTGMEPGQIDACMKLGASYPMGPLALLDLIGIDVAEAIGEALHADTGEPSHRPPGRVKELVGEGRLGRKSGRGFYEYPD